MRSQPTITYAIIIVLEYFLCYYFLMFIVTLPTSFYCYCLYLITFLSSIDIKKIINFLKS
jgi:hypothetical protein